MCPYHHMWIYAQAPRPEGTYILAYGSIWAAPDAPPAQHILLHLTNGGSGGIYLLRTNHSCEPLWDADNAFNFFFPANPDHRPTQAQTSIIQDLATDLIRREVKIFGGKKPFLDALAATGIAIHSQDSVMIPLLEALRSTHAL